MVSLERVGGMSSRRLCSAYAYAARGNWGRGLVLTMNTALLICILTNHVGGMRVVVECLGGHVSKVSESVPLSTGLGVHMVDIIKSTSLVKINDFVLEYLAAKRWL